MSNEIMTISGVSCYENDGTAYLSLEAVARGLGFTKTDIKISETSFRKEYVRIDWPRVEKYLAELGFSQKVAKDSFIPENIFYRLAMKAKNETAERFQALVADEIIPSIRKTGGYISGQETMSDSELMAKALLVAQRQIDERNKQIAAMQPKALFADAVSASDDCILVRDMAKILRQNGVDLGEKRFYAWLRKNGYLTQDNSPTQRASDLGLFKMHERTISSPDGEIRIRKTTKVTGKGQRYFIKKFLGQSDIRTTGN